MELVKVWARSESFSLTDEKDDRLDFSAWSSRRLSSVRSILLKGVRLSLNSLEALGSIRCIPETVGVLTMVGGCDTELEFGSRL